MKTLRALASGFSILLIVVAVIGIFSSFSAKNWSGPFQIAATLLTILVCVVAGWTGWNNRRALRRVETTDQFNTLFFITNVLACLVPLPFIRFLIVDALAHDGLDFANVLVLFVAASPFAAPSILSIIVGIKAKRQPRPVAVSRETLSK